MHTLHNQENITHGLKTAGAFKPLNQITKGLGHKDSTKDACKTPFKLPLHKDDPALQSGKVGDMRLAREKENAVTEGKNNFALKKNAYTTPSGELFNRAPLRNKTTNAKATSMQRQTAFPNQKGTVKVPHKPLSPRLRRPRVTIHQSANDESVLIDDEPEIEYAPPRVKDLSNFTDDDTPYERLHQLFSGRNLMRGYNSVYIDPIDEQGTSQSERQFERERDKAMAEQDALISKDIDEMEFFLRDEPETIVGIGSTEEDALYQGIPIDTTWAKSENRHHHTAAISLSLQESAVAKLSQEPKSSGYGATAGPHYATPTASSIRAQKSQQALSRAKSALDRKAKLPETSTATSKSTLGYRKGRSVSAALNKTGRVHQISELPCL